MTQALYRRYRPQTFSEVIGQEHVTQPLMAALRSGRVSHAYLFSGPRGCGKTTSARILARCLNCAQGPTPEPCGECDSCRELGRGGTGSLDVVEIDAASHNGVDDARELRDRAMYAASRDRFKVFILDEAHMVTNQGFNALLKVVEEPPPHVKFIFATTEPEKVIGTIRSRTHHYPFRLVPPGTMLTYMEQLCQAEGIAADDGVLPLVVKAGGGSVRDSESVLDQLMAGASDGRITYEGATALLGFTPEAHLEAMAQALVESDAGAAFRVVDAVVEAGGDPRRFVEDLLERLGDLVILAAAGDSGSSALASLPADTLEGMKAQAKRLGLPALSRAADAVNAGLAAMTGATSPRLQLELLVARMLVDAAAAGGGLGGALGAGLAGGAMSGLVPGGGTVQTGPLPVSGPAAPAPQVDTRGLSPRAAAEARAAARAAATPPPTAMPAATPPPSSTPATAAPAAAGPARTAPAPTAAPATTPAPAASASATPARTAPTPSAPAPMAPAPMAPASAAPARTDPAPAAPAAPGAEPSAAPAPVPAPAPAPFTLAAVRARWSELIDHVQEHSTMVGRWLANQPRLVDAEGTTVTFAFNSGGEASSLANPRFADPVKAGFKELFGLDIKIETVVQPGGGTNPSGIPATGGAPRAASAGRATGTAPMSGQPGDSPRPSGPPANAERSQGGPAAAPRGPGAAHPGGPQPGGPQPGGPQPDGPQPAGPQPAGPQAAAAAQAAPASRTAPAPETTPAPNQPVPPARPGAADRPGPAAMRTAAAASAQVKATAAATAPTSTHPPAAPGAVDGPAAPPARPPAAPGAPATTPAARTAAAATTPAAATEPAPEPREEDLLPSEGDADAEAAGLIGVGAVLKKFSGAHVISEQDTKA